LAATADTQEGLATRITGRIVPCVVKSFALATLFLNSYAIEAANPAPGDMLKFRPRQDVQVATPSEADAAKCTVELLRGGKLANGKASSGWLLRDAKGATLRRFVDSDGDGHVDIWSYYLDNAEVYREIDSNANGKPDQFRWLGVAGSKWGVSRKEDGKIDTWAVISPEEVSQEVLASVIAKDYARLQALMPNKEDLEALQLPETEVNRIKTAMTAASAKFSKTTTSLSKLSEKTRWVHLETKMPQTVPADAIGGRADLVRHKQGTILYQDGDKHDWLQTGELIQIGRTWRVIDAPVPGSVIDSVNPAEVASANTSNVDLPEEAKPYLDKLKDLDAAAPKPGDNNERIAKFNMERAAILEKIVAAVKGADREAWIKQIADCYNAAIQSNPKEKAGYDQLLQWQGVAEKSGPGNNLAAYVSYRAMSADYSRRLSEAKNSDMAKLQEDWRDKLAKYVGTYPTSEDTPEALIQLGMLSEFMGKEADANGYYKQLVKNFEKHPMAGKANGAIERLALDGKELILKGTTLGSGNAFDLGTLKGKTVVVYYWASWNQQSAADFARLKPMLSVHGNKLELVCVNVDSSANEAINFLRTTPVPGVHLFSPGGMESPLATQYGVFVLPNIFVVGPDGKVVNRNAQMQTLEDDVKKAIKDSK
jgi:hypothetical protein